MNAQAISEQLIQIRKNQPLVHNITNYVVMNWTANCLLALGASPVMAHAVDEVEEMVGISNSLVVNLGTLSGPWVESMSKAMAAARKRSIPTILDPVGAGATQYRTEVARRLLDQSPPTVIRGNASEIQALAGLSRTTKGVDSIAVPEAALEAATRLNGTYKSVVCISGATDFIVAEGRVQSVSYGHPIMARVTGKAGIAKRIRAMTFFGSRTVHHFKAIGCGQRESIREILMAQVVLYLRRSPHF